MLSEVPPDVGFGMAAFDSLADPERLELLIDVLRGELEAARALERIRKFDATRQERVEDFRI